MRGQTAQVQAPAQVQAFAHHERGGFSPPVAVALDGHALNHVQVQVDFLLRRWRQRLVKSRERLNGRIPAFPVGKLVIPTL